MTTTHRSRSLVNKATVTKPRNGRRNNSTSRSLNSKSSPGKTKPRALNDVQSAINNVKLDCTPPNITHFCANFSLNFKQQSTCETAAKKCLAGG
jgi:hypothetical protein